MAKCRKIPTNQSYSRGVYRVFIIGFPTSGVGRYFNRGGEATSDTQLNPGNLE